MSFWILLWQKAIRYWSISLFDLSIAQIRYIWAIPSLKRTTVIIYIWVIGSSIQTSRRSSHYYIYDHRKWPQIHTLVEHRVKFFGFFLFWRLTKIPYGYTKFENYANLAHFLLQYGHKINRWSTRSKLKLVFVQKIRMVYNTFYKWKKK